MGKDNIMHPHMIHSFADSRVSSRAKKKKMFCKQTESVAGAALNCIISDVPNQQLRRDFPRRSTINTQQRMIDACL